MTGRILVVDDIEANVRLLQAKLAAEYYDVLTAPDGLSALEIAARERPDLVLLDVMMPGMDGFETCRRLKEEPATRHIPVVLVTALDGRGDRITGLEAGADEFLNKPIDDIMLFARVKSLTRLKLVIDELRQREASGRRIGVIAGAASRLGGGGGRVLIVDDHERQAQRIYAELAIEHRPVVESDPEKAHLTARGPVDLIIVNTTARAFDGLRFAAQIRSDEATRHLPILGVIDTDDRQRLVKALDIGFNDILTRPIDPQELSARVRSQVRGKRYTDFLRNNLDHSLELAVTDQLTGLHNRRYMTSTVASLGASRGARPGAATLAVGADDRHRSLQEDQRQLRPRHRRRGAARVRGAARFQRARDRPAVPLRRRGIHGDHARHQPGGCRPHRRTDPQARRRLALPRAGWVGTAVGDDFDRGGYHLRRRRYRRGAA